MNIDEKEALIIITNSTNNLMLNNYLNMKKVIEDIKNYIHNDDEELIINLIKEYRNNLLINCYNKNYKNKIIKNETEKQEFKEQFEWFYNLTFDNFSTSLIQEKANIKSLNRYLNHYNDDGKFIYNQKPFYYYSSLRLDNNTNFLNEINDLYLMKYKNN